MKKAVFLSYLVGISILIGGCRHDPILPGKPYEIIFLGHTYQHRDRMDARLEKINYDRYGQVWLGGDMLSETTEAFKNLRYLDKYFGLGRSTRHWALGNHDVRNGNLQWINEFTNRKSFYVHHDRGLTIIVLNTNLYEPECAALSDQYKLIKEVADTIQHSSHLILLSHHVAWGKVEPNMDMGSHANAPKDFWRAVCEPNTEFQNSIYPLLVDVQQKGVKVICLAGDFGQRKKSYQYQTQEGIWLLGSGLNKGLSSDIDEEDAALIFHHHPTEKSLDWEFVLLRELQ